MKPLSAKVIKQIIASPGLNGLDNGYLILNKVRVPRSAMLNKLGEVSREGKYVTPFKDKSKRFGAVLGALSGGRIGITGLVSTNLGECKLSVKVLIDARSCILYLKRY